MISDSLLPLVEICAAAGALPRPRNVSAAADLGSAVHEHLELRVLVGVEVAFDAIERTADSWKLEGSQRGIFAARCRKFRFSPPPGALAEVPLAWTEEGSVVAVKGGRGQYDVPEGCWGPGTLDVMWSEPEPLQVEEGSPPRCPAGSTLFVADYKTGDEAWVHPIETNAQLAALSAKAATWTHAQAVVPAVIFVRGEEGVWDVPAAPWGPDKISSAAASTRLIHERVAHQQELLKTGQAVDTVEGPHCRFCPAQAACPAKTEQLKRLIGERCADVAMLTAEGALHWANMLPALERLAANAKAALQAYVQLTGEPIDLGNGNVWGPREEGKDRLLPGPALEVLRELVGEEAAVSAVKITKKAFCETAKESADRGEGAIAVRKALSMLGERGGILSEPTVKWTVFRKGTHTEPATKAPRVSASPTRRRRKPEPIDL